MKFASIVVLLALSASAMATEFYAKIDNTECSIINGVVTSKTSFGKEFTGSFTQTKNVSIEGLTPFIDRAIVTATQTTSDSGLLFTMKHEGKTYVLNAEDSMESMSLVRMITKVCR
jgi:hypothetical protein